MKTKNLAVQKALEHVRQFFPNVNTVLYGTDGRWLFLDGIEAPNFEGYSIDVSILEQAADSVNFLPAVFTVDN